MQELPVSAGYFFFYPLKKNDRVVLFVFLFNFSFFLPIGWFHFINVAPLQLHEVLR